MKKIIALVLSLVVLLMAFPGFAAGKISVEDEFFYAVESYSLYGYAFAKVSNVGNKPIKVHAGILEVFDKEGDTITSTDSLRAYAEYLQPDEYTYIKMQTELENVTVDDVDDYLLTITGKSDSNYETRRFPCTAEYQQNVRESYFTYDYLCATVTNDTDEPVFGLKIVMALLDADDNILYVCSDNLYSGQALMPGSSMLFRESVDSSFRDYFEANDLVPDHVDAIAYLTYQVD